MQITARRFPPIAAVVSAAALSLSERSTDSPSVGANVGTAESAAAASPTIRA